MAARAVTFFKSLRIVDAPGSPTFGEACDQFVFDFVAAIFGAYDEETGRRLINEFFFLISKKNSKSTVSAGIMLTALMLNWRKSAEFYILAPTIEVADNSFIPMRDMIEADPELKYILKVQGYMRRVEHIEQKAFVKVIAADEKTTSGKKATGVLIDELHEFGNSAKAENMITEATGGLASRIDGFVIYSSTQSAEPPAGVFKSKLMYARHVRDGVIEDKTFLPIIYEFPQFMLDKNEHLEFKNAYITNPNLGRSVDEAFLEKKYKQSLELGEGNSTIFLAKHLNVEVGIALRSNRWAGARHWEKRGVLKNFTLDELIERSEVIAVGIDGGGLDDLFGFAVIGRDKKTKKWLVWAHAWAHDEVYDTRKDIVSRLEDFEKAGELTRVDEGSEEDMHQVAALCEKINASGKLYQIGMDPAGLGTLVTELELVGIDKDKDCRAVRQGYMLGGAIKVAERKLASGGMIHSCQGLMAWCVGNAKIEARANGILITKQKNGSGKIDPLMALFSAVELMTDEPEPKGAGMNDYTNNGFFGLL